MSASICLVLEWYNGLAARAQELMFTHQVIGTKGKGNENSFSNDSNKANSQETRVKAMYSDSVLDLATTLLRIPRCYSVPAEDSN